MTVRYIRSRRGKSPRPRVFFSLFALPQYDASVEKLRSINCINCYLQINQSRKTVRIDNVVLLILLTFRETIFYVLFVLILKT